MHINSIDIFCEVIDNFGDVGFSYRLARELFNRYNKKVKIRLIIDKDSEFKKISGGMEREISVITYEELISQKKYIEASDIVIETFGCNVPKKYLNKSYENSKLIINIEYFSAEDWIDDFHLKESIIPNSKVKKIFYMPGLSDKSGGVIIDNNFLKTINKIQLNKEFYMKKYGIDDGKYDLIGTIFSYEKDFSKFLYDLSKTKKKTLLFILSEKTQKNFNIYFDNNNYYDTIDFVKSPFYSYNEYEELISLVDFNLVRGEDSFVRALILGKPFLWHIYPQEKNIHMGKLKSFLEKYDCDEKLKDIFISYNNSYNEDYRYFFENLNKIEMFNKDFSEYLIKNNNLIEKIYEYIKNLGGNNENCTRIESW